MRQLTPGPLTRTDDMVERFNDRVADVLKTNRFSEGDDLERSLKRYAKLYNQDLPQSLIKSKNPMQVMKERYRIRPNITTVQLTYARP